MARTIAVTGKGGVGKTTVAALIIRYLKENSSGPILAIDADPDCNLATLLGIDVPCSIGDLREEVLLKIKDLPLGMSKDAYIEAGLHEIIVETPKVDLITMGRGEGPGCYCFINNVLRKFADDLMPSYQWLVMDNEAGMEHISRRTASHIDHLIVVVDANPLSLASAGRIDQLVRGLKRKVRSKYYLLNAVDDKQAAGVRKKMSDSSLEYLGCVPRDRGIEDVIFRGESIYALQSSPALEAIGEVMRTIGAG
ncbi:MAG: ATP-binding protein [Planctomycetota bacterium]|jgi:CO dehydrogenase maturation factor